MFGLADGGLQAGDRQRIFGAHVDVTLIGADRVAGDRHAFEHPMGIALEHATVHERPGIALIGVADDEFALALRLGHGRPLKPGRIPGAAPAPQAALDEVVNHLLGLHFQQHLVQRLVTLGGDIGFDALRIDHAAVFQHDGHLLRKEGVRRIALLRRGFAAFERLDDGRDLVRGDFFVQRAIGVHLDQRTLATETHATHAHYLHRIGQARLFNGLVERGFDLLAVRGHAARRHATANAVLFMRLLFLLRDFQ